MFVFPIQRNPFALAIMLTAHYRKMNSNLNENILFLEVFVVTAGLWHHLKMN
jgi:hypothetical protein